MFHKRIRNRHSIWQIKKNIIQMKVLKFGGTSVANAENINKVINIITKNDEAQIIVVSALGGVTDALIKAGTLAEKNR